MLQLFLHHIPLRIMAFFVTGTPFMVTALITVVISISEDCNTEVYCIDQRMIRNLFGIWNLMF
jgi:hypothetical protein